MHMSRMVEMLMYGAIAGMQIAVAIFLLEYYLPRTAHSNRAPQPAPMRSSRVDPGPAIPLWVQPRG